MEDDLFAKGKKALAHGDTLSALACFEKAAHGGDDLSVRSYLAYCMAKERGLLHAGMSLCEEIIAKEPENAVHYLNLGKILLLMKKREEAVRQFRRGLTYGANSDIANELEKLGVRRTPVIPFLRRSHPLNKYLGIVRTFLGRF